MSTIPEEAQLQNGVIPEPEPGPDQITTSQLEPNIEQPKPEAEEKPEPETEARAADHKPDQHRETSIQSNEEQSRETSIQLNAVDDVPTSGQTTRPELRKDEGSRTFTMRELLNELKSDEGDESLQDSAVSPYSQESTPQQHVENDPAMDLINSVTGSDEEGRSRQRVLAFAARKYSSAIERNPEDYDALYNWALVLQESADIVSTDSTTPSKDALLEEACKKYDEATRLCPTLHDAFYNWAIAISDRAKMRGRTKEAEDLWKQV